MQSERKIDQKIDLADDYKLVPVTQKYFFSNN